jgi:hypothetical protein
MGRNMQYEDEARRFLADLRERMEKFALTLHPEKTRLISAATPKKLAPRVGWASRRHSTSWGLRIFARAADAVSSSSSGRRGGIGCGRRTSTAHTRTDPGAGSMASTSGTRIFRLPCRADQLPTPQCFSLPYQRLLDADLAGSQSEGSPDMGEATASGNRLSAEAAHPTSLA